MSIGICNLRKQRGDGNAQCYIAGRITPDMHFEHNREYVSSMKHIAIENHKTSKVVFAVGTIFVLTSISWMARWEIVIHT